VSDLLQLVAKKRNDDGHSLRAAEYKRVADTLVDGEATSEPPAATVSAEANDAPAESMPPAAPPRIE
jgi:hypothetical protein